jgi:hypothetical protein
MTSQPTLAGPPEPFRTNIHDSRLVEQIAKWWKWFCRKKNDAGRSGYHLMWIFLCIAPIFQKSRISFGKNGGDDETRNSRPLPRQSGNNKYLQQLTRLPGTAKYLKIRSSRRDLGLAFGLKRPRNSECVVKASECF